MMYSVEDFIDDPDMYVLDIRGNFDNDPYHLRAEFDDIEELLDTITFRLKQIGFMIPPIECRVISDGRNVVTKERDFFWFSFKSKDCTESYTLYVKYIRSDKDFLRIKKRVEQIIAFYDYPGDDAIDSLYVCYDPSLDEIVCYENESSESSDCYEQMTETDSDE